MKKLLFFFALLFMGAMTVFAQVPTNQQLTYQTVVRNAQNQLVFSQNNVSVTVEVCNLDGSVVRYSETHTGLSTNANGLLTLMVGGGTRVSGAWTDIVWSDAAIRTTITYNPGTCTVTIPSGLAPVSAVPYALQAGSVTNITNIIGDAIHDSIVNNISEQIHDSLTNALNDYTIQNCDDVNDCVSTAIADGNSVINHAIDTVVLNNVGDAIADGNSEINHAIDTVVLNNVGDAIADGNSEINHAIDTVVLNNIGDAIADGNSDINHAIDTIVNNIAGSAIHDSLTNALNDYTIQNCDDVNDCVSTAIADGNSVINHAIDTVVLNNIGDAIADGNSDINHAIDTIVNNITSNAIHDSLTNALNDYEIQNCDDVNNCVSTAIADGNSVINHAIDTVVLNNVSDAIADGNSEINHAIDTVVLNNVGDAIADGNSDINHAIDTIVNNIAGSAIHDSLTNALNDYTIQNCDDVNDCVSTAIADGNSVINHAIDTVVLNNVGDAIADGNSEINHAIDTVVLNNVGDAIADGNSDINHAIDTIVNNIAGSAIHDSLTNALNDYEIQNCDDVNNCVSTAIADGNSVINHAIDTVVLNNVSGAIADGNSDINHAIDTVVLNNVSGAIADGNSDINHAIDTVVLNNVGDAIADGNSDINHAIDTIVNNIAGSAIHDSLTNALNDYTIQNCDDVNDCVSTAIADGNSVINHAIDTVVLNNVGDAIADGNSEINHAIDTVVLNNVGDAIADGNSEINHAIDTVVLNNVGDAIADGNSDINHAIDTVVLNNIGNAIADGNSDINHAIDTIVNNITSSAIHDSLTNALNDYEIQNCDDVNKCVANAIANGNSDINHAIDTVVLNNVGDAIADGNSGINHAIDTIVNNIAGSAIHDTLTNNHYVTETVMGNAIHDSIAHISGISDLTELTNRVNTFNTHVCDSVRDCVTGWIHDSIANNIADNIGSAIHDSIVNNIENNISERIHDSIVYNIENNISEQIHDSITNYLAAGDYVTETDLCNTIETNCTNVVLKNGDNIFIGDNDFTDGSITVPNAIVPDLATVLADTCNQKAVNLCDLLAVFDSLCRRIEKLENAIPPVANAPTVSNVTSTSMNVKANAISQGAAITSYEFCISTNSDMSGATCQTVLASDADNYTFTGLDPNTNYYVQYSATNFAGTTTSPTVQERTLAHAPTADVTPPAPTKPAGFDVPVDNVDPKEKDEATVQVCYVLKGSGDCPEKESPSYSDCSDPVTVTDGGSAIISKTGLEASTEYCVIVKVSNGDSTTIYGPYTATTGTVATLSVTSDAGSTVNLCGETTVDVPFTATITGDDASDYTFAWSDGTSTTSKDTVALAAGTHTITVTATSSSHTLTASTSVTVNNGTAVSIGFCEYEGVVSVIADPQGSPNSISWGDGQSSDGTVSTSTMHDYTTTLATGPHEVTITASNSDGCIFSRTMTVNVFGSGSTAADRTVKPCSVSASHDAQIGTDYTGNGHNGANHGLETVNGSGQVTSVTDYDGNEYPVVQIGNQCWMAENLRVSHSPKTGSNIVVTAVANNNSKMAAWYKNDQSTYEAKRYGLLYNWCAAMDTANPSGYVEVTTTAANTSTPFSFTHSGNHQGVCPVGWHVPTDAEWNAMELEVNGSDVSGSTGYRGSHAGKLSTGCDWNSNNVEQDETTSKPGNYSYTKRNESGFSVVPAGYFSNLFGGSAGNAYFWSSSQDGKEVAWYRVLGFKYAGVSQNILGKGSACSVRCVRD